MEGVEGAVSELVDRGIEATVKPYFDNGRIQIYHADCRDVLPILKSSSVGVVITDPPFSIPVRYHDSKGSHPRSWGDLMVMEPFFNEIFSQLRRVVCKDGQVYIHCDAETYPVFYKSAYSLWPQSHLIVWYKPTGRRGRGWLHSHELILHLRTSLTKYAPGFRQDVIGIMPVRTLNRQHPAQKPGELVSFIMEAVPTLDTIDTVILDPFMGSGVNLLVAQNLGLRAIGIEIEEKYCEIAVKRLRQEVLNFK